MSVLSLTTQQRIELRDKVLRYFEAGRRVEGIAHAPDFTQYSHRTVHRMVHALHIAGHLERIGGRSRDTAYRTVR